MCADTSPAGLARFKFIDADGSGDLTMSELVLGGHLTKSQAEQLFEKCRRKNDAAISDKDTSHVSVLRCMLLLYPDPGARRIG
jgi:hypothetical protein